jgi:hypothetical protein
MFQFGLRDYWHDVVLREDSSTRFAITSRIFAATSGRSMVEGSNSAFEGCCSVLWRMVARRGPFDSCPLNQCQDLREGPKPELFNGLGHVPLET